jgi:hypothetical protein
VSGCTCPLVGLLNWEAEYFAATMLFYISHIESGILFKGSVDQVLKNMVTCALVSINSQIIYVNGPC